MGVHFKSTHVIFHTEYQIITSAYNLNYYITKITYSIGLNFETFLAISGHTYTNT